MRFVNAGGRAGLLVDGLVYDLAELSGGQIPGSPMEVVTDFWEQALVVFETGSFGGGTPVDQVHLGPPVPSPPSVYAIGMNYKKHAVEAGLEVRPIPAVFTKFPSSLTGPYDPIVLPQGEGTTDWEAELAFVMGSGGRSISAREALDNVRGFTIAQDISERFVQMAAGHQFSLGKSFDTFCPMGPAIVTLDELADPNALRITCKLNGATVQDDTTADMIVDIPHLIELLSSVMTLSAGDVCLTGTPAGVGFGRTPPVYLRPDDVLETTIEGLGTMRNVCVAEADFG
jgi:2-keto-4-pentenoate hydratase/2-oxohepta-3-ene-1,7-dioic acid hydratase in catechol pathway